MQKESGAASLVRSVLQLVEVKRLPVFFVHESSAGTHLPAQVGQRVTVVLLTVVAP